MEWEHLRKSSFESELAWTVAFGHDDVESDTTSGSVDAICKQDGFCADAAVSQPLLIRYSSRGRTFVLTLKACY